MHSTRSWRRALFWAGVALAAAAAGLGWFVVRVANPRLGSQQEIEGLAVPSDFDGHDPIHVESWLVTLADRLVARPLNAGIVIGVTRGGARHTVARGVSSRPDPARIVHDSTLFEVGSITKTFTGVALAQAVLDGAVKLEQPISSLLPDPTNLSPAGNLITLANLATHTAGLPSNPPSISFLSGLSLFE